MDDRRRVRKDDGPAGRPTYDDSDWPIFVVKMPSHQLSDVEFVAHLEAMREPYRRGQPFGLLIVMGDYPPLPPTQRKAAAEAMKSDAQRHPGLLRGKAIVIRSTLERGVVTAVAWMAQPSYPFAAFETEALAKSWLLRHLRSPMAG